MRETIENVFQTDVLVIGAGAAGIRAAIEAARAGANVLLVEKGKWPSGASTFNHYERGWSYQTSWNEKEVKAHFDEIVSAGLEMQDNCLVDILTRDAPARFNDLLDFGVEFASGSLGLITEAGCFGPGQRAVTTTNKDNIRSAFRQALEDNGITLVDCTGVVSLLVADSTCKGALAVNSEERLVAIGSAATILATGGGSYCYQHNLNYPEQTADGWILAFDAGATLSNCEFIQFTYGTMSHPKRIVTAWFFKPGSRFYDGNGKDLLSRHIPSWLSREELLMTRSTHGPFSSRDYGKWLDIAIFREITTGRPSEHGGVYADLSATIGHLPETEDLFASDVRRQLEWYRQEGINLLQPIEIAHHAHAFNGGILINEEAETNVRGLFAAGETIAGPHGADRLGGNMMTLTQVFGSIAGRNAARNAETSSSLCSLRDLAKDSYFSHVERLPGVAQAATTYPEARAKLASLMWNEVGVERTDNGLQRALRAIENLREREVRRPTSSDEGGVLEATSLRSMLKTSELIAESALRRRESRGSHCRRDYPELDPNLGFPIRITNQDGEADYRFGAQEDSRIQ